MNWVKQNRIKFGLGILILGVLSSVNGWGRWNKDTDAVSLRCPEDYATADDYKNDLEIYLTKLAKEKPDMTLEDFSKERIKFLEDNHCQKTLDHINSTDTYSSDELGFSFRYPNYLLAEVYPDQPNWVVVFPKSKQADEKEPMTAIIISESTDDLVYMTAEEWLNGPNSGYKASRDGQYKHIKIGGQDAVITSNDWAVVKSPDGKKRISIAYLVEQEKGAKPLHTELQEILDTFSFK